MSKVGRIFCILICFMLFVLFVRLVVFQDTAIDSNGFISSTNSESIIPRFSDLMLFFTNDVETFQIPLLDLDSITFGDWGAFDFLKVFIESLAKIVNVALFIVNGLIQLITFVFWIIQWLFIS